MTRVNCTTAMVVAKFDDGGKIKGVTHDFAPNKHEFHVFSRGDEDSKALPILIKDLKVAADINAVPPAGIEGLGAQDDAEPLGATGALGIGALAVGNVKYQVESGLFRRMIEDEEPLCLDFRDAFQMARGLLG